MVFKIGNMALPSQEYFEKLIEWGVLARHDVSVRAREEHDLEIAEKYNHQYYFHEERARAWKEGLIEEKEKKPLGNFICVNPWIVGGD